MPFEHVSAGKPIRISAADWNGAMDAARAVKGAPPLPPPAPPTGRSPFRVMNSSGTDVERFGILGIDDAIILPADNLNEFQSKILFVGVTPNTDDHSGKFVICQEPIKDGRIGECMAMGVSPALVSEEEGDFADVLGSSTVYLNRGGSGARILWADPADADGHPGYHWAYVAVGGGGGSDCECEEVHEVRLEGVVTGSTLTLTYTIDGVTGSAATIHYNDTSIDASSSLIASHPAFTADNLLVYDGPFPNVAMYIRFAEDLAGRRHPLPAVTSSLTGTAAIAKVGRFTSPGLGT